MAMALFSTPPLPSSHHQTPFFQPQRPYSSTSFGSATFINYYPFKPTNTISLSASASSSSSPSSSSSVSTAKDETPASPDGTPVPSDSSTVAVEESPLRGCKACGREEFERGCNGEGRIQGGIATVPGFGWWPIKAYRPCPGFVASGGRYKRRGQSMDEVASGGGGRRRSPVGTSDEAEAEAEPMNKKQGPRKFKR